MSLLQTFIEINNDMVSMLKEKKKTSRKVPFGKTLDFARSNTMSAQTSYSAFHPSAVRGR